MVFQSPALYPHMTVRKNLGFALALRSTPAREIERRVALAARLLGIESLLPRRPGELSGGQQHRVALGKSIVYEPQLWLLDEPLVALDAPLRRQLGREIAALCRATGTTTLYVTHDQAEALALAERLIVVHGGRVQQQGPPGEVYARPANRFVASFLGDPPMNLLRGHVEAGVFRSGIISAPFPRQSHDGPVELGIRPEHIRLALAAQGGSPRPDAPFITRLEFRGDAAIVEVQALDHTLSVRTSPDALHSVGSLVSLTFPPESCHYFAATDEGNRLEK
jgi:ABC-type sugar transport system ATPase subunit